MEVSGIQLNPCSHKRHKLRGPLSHISHLVVQRAMVVLTYEPFTKEIVTQRTDVRLKSIGQVRGTLNKCAKLWSVGTHYRNVVLQL